MVPGLLTLNQVDLEWLLWLLSPVLATFLLPLGILLMLYLCALLLQLFHLRGYLCNISYANTQISATKLLATLWTAHGRIWHGYEVMGLENIPDNGPALIIYYHATLPIDLYYLLATIYSRKNRVVYCVGDNLLYKVPGFKKMMKELRVIPGTVASCVELLKAGNLLAIAPGGVREALFGDEYYNLLWGQRRGFGKVVKESKVPVIPVFTKNCREAFRTLNISKREYSKFYVGDPILIIFSAGLLRNVYEKYRLPIVPIYGGFPVKLKTILGKPFFAQNTATVEQIVDEVKSLIEGLIIEHQRVPGNILFSIFERFSGG